MSRSDDDASFMGLALRLARGGTGATYPNPSVGAVVISRGEVIGAGSSEPTGGRHAEVKALAAAGQAARGATIYVTLEPCSHHGRTPPCTSALIAAGVAEVVYGVRDPAAHARGRGRQTLEAAGIRVRERVLLEHCARAHEHYLHHVRRGRPFVTLKAASSLDGRIACANGDSRWITGKPARAQVHRLRAEHHAIAVGVGTLLRADPRLTVRMVEGTDPLPVVFDSSLRAFAEPSRPQLLRAPTLVLHTARAPRERVHAARERGVTPLEVAADAAGRVSVDAALDLLGQRSIRSLLVEGGGQLLSSFVRADAWDRWYLFHAPVLLGEGLPLLPGLGWSQVARAPRVSIRERETVGQDMLYVLEPLGRDAPARPEDDDIGV
jgi:diaminohydroxyphosphoribosylaminopyrimidine deaminase/5-amino-6-(5-phosphoribosylamino)uracil reductase